MILVVLRSEATVRSWISVLLVILFSGAAFSEVTLIEDSERAGERKLSAFAEQFGKNYERNLFLVTKGLGRTRPIPSDVLKEEAVQVELGLSESQLDDLKELRIGAPLLPQLMALAGLDENKNVGSLDKKQATAAGVMMIQQFKDHRIHREKKVQDILSPKQYERMKEIFHQKTLLFGVSAQVAESFDVSHGDIVKLNLALREADREIAAEAEKMKWRMYLEHFDKALGPGSSSRTFGEPYYIEVENEESKERRNRRREG